MTDEELSEYFSVSIQTIRLDRLELGIPELRERVKYVAEQNYRKLRSIEGKEIVGELIDLDLGKSAISMLQTDESMVFEKSKIVEDITYSPKPNLWLLQSLIAELPQVLKI